MAKNDENFDRIYSESLSQMTDLTDKQKNVLKAALELFSTKGYEETTSADISKKAGVAAGTIYKKFPNKRAILIAVLAPAFDVVLPKTVEDFAKKTLQKNYTDLPTLIHTIVDDRVNFIEVNYLSLKVLISQALNGDGEVLNAFKKEATKQMQKYMIKTIKSFIKQGKMVDWPVSEIIAFIISPIFGYFGKKLFGVSVDKDKEISLTTQFIVKGLTPQK